MTLLPVSHPWAAAEPDAAEYVAVTPDRVADTCDGTGVQRGTVGAGRVLEVPVAPRSEVPADAAPVWLNITVTQPTTGGWAAAYPCGAPRPLASNLNFTGGTTIANAAAVAVGDGGRICLYTTATTHFVVDLNGFFPAGSPFAAFNPERIADTRDGTGVRPGILTGGQVLTVPVDGPSSVPSDAKAVSLNVTAAGSSAGGFLTVYPCGQSRPTASNVYFSAKETIPNAVVAGVGDDATVCVFSNVPTHVVVDINGFYPATAAYRPSNPAPAADTRNCTGVPTGLVLARQTLPVPVAGKYGVPPDAAAVTLNVTATETGASGFLTVHACGTGRPLASNLNYGGGLAARIHWQRVRIRLADYAHHRRRARIPSGHAPGR